MKPQKRAEPFAHTLGFFTDINIVLNHKHHFQLHNPLAPIVFYEHINAGWLAANALFMRSATPPISPPPPCRSGGAGGGHLRVQDPGGGAVRAGGLLVPVRGLELGGHHQEQPRLRSDRMWVPRVHACECVCLRL